MTPINKKKSNDKSSTNKLFEIASKGSWSRLFATAFILLSIIIWYSIITSVGYNKILYDYGTDAARTYTSMVEIPSQFVIFTIFLVVLRSISDFMLFMVTVIVGWTNFLLYIVDPNKLFRWVDSKNIYGK